MGCDMFDAIGARAVQNYHYTPASPSVKYIVLKFCDIRFGKPTQFYRVEPFEYFNQKLDDIRSRFMSVYESGLWRTVHLCAGCEGEEVKSYDARQVDGFPKENTSYERQRLIEPLD